MKIDSILYDFSLDKDNRISYLYDYTKFIKEKKISDSKIQTWHNENIMSVANINLENIKKKVKLLNITIKYNRAGKIQII